MRPCKPTLSNDISKPSGPILIKFYRCHHWGRGLAVIGLMADLVRTLVSMAIKRSHRHIMGKMLSGQ